MKHKWDELLAHLLTRGLKLGIPYPILDALLLSLFSAYFNNDHPCHSFPDTIQQAVDSQIQMGFMYLVPQGFITMTWIDAMTANIKVEKLQH
jgi:hypothetical protein